MNGTNMPSIGKIYSLKETPSVFAKYGFDFGILIEINFDTGIGKIVAAKIASESESSSYSKTEKLSAVNKSLYEVAVDFSSSVFLNELGNCQTEIENQYLRALIKGQINSGVKEYFNLIHKPVLDKKFVPGVTKINYCGRIWNEDEMVNLIDSSLRFYLTADRYDRKFCKGLSNFLCADSDQKIHTMTANSGSSANLLAISSLTSHKLGDLQLRKGDEVITVAAGFPTTVAPIIQNGLVPVFVDVEFPTYNINCDQIEEAISSKTKAIFVAHTLGIPFNIEKVLEIAEKHKLWVIEDNCDALGAEATLTRNFNLINDKIVNISGKTGTFGHIGTSSFYPAHQITMGEGGAVYCSNELLRTILLSFRDWGRDCYCDPGKDNSCGKRFEWQLGTLPCGYDHKYTYSHLGYNLKITDMQAAIGCAQLEKLPNFAEKRFENWKLLREGLRDLEEFFILPNFYPNTKPSPFGFALTIRDKCTFKRNEITQFLEEKKIQTRVVFTGNLLRQPAIVNSDFSHRVLNDLPVTENIMNNTFWVGVYPGLDQDRIDYMISNIEEFTKKS